MTFAALESAAVDHTAGPFFVVAVGLYRLLSAADFFACFRVNILVPLIHFYDATQPNRVGLDVELVIADDVGGRRQTTDVDQLVLVLCRHLIDRRLDGHPFAFVQAGSRFHSSAFVPKQQRH